MPTLIPIAYLYYALISEWNDDDDDNFIFF